MNRDSSGARRIWRKKPPLRREGATEAPQRSTPRPVDDDVPTARTVREVLGGVVDHVIGAERTDQVGLRPAAHAGDLGAERLRDLHGERAHTARPWESSDPHSSVHCRSYDMKFRKHPRSVLNAWSTKAR